MTTARPRPLLPDPPDHQRLWVPRTGSASRAPRSDPAASSGAYGTSRFRGSTPLSSPAVGGRLRAARQAGVRLSLPRARAPRACWSCGPWRCSWAGSCLTRPHCAPPAPLCRGRRARHAPRSSGRLARLWRDVRALAARRTAAAAAAAARGARGAAAVVRGTHPTLRRTGARRSRSTTRCRPRASRPSWREERRTGTTGRARGHPALPGLCRVPGSGPPLSPASRPRSKRCRPPRTRRGTAAALARLSVASFGGEGGYEAPLLEVLFPAAFSLPAAAAGRGRAAPLLCGAPLRHPQPEPVLPQQQRQRGGGRDTVRVAGSVSEAHVLALLAAAEAAGDAEGGAAIVLPLVAEGPQRIVGAALLIVRGGPRRRGRGRSPRRPSAASTAAVDADRPRPPALLLPPPLPPRPLCRPAPKTLRPPAPRQCTPPRARHPAHPPRDARPPLPPPSGTPSQPTPRRASSASASTCAPCGTSCPRARPSRACATPTQPSATPWRPCAAAEASAGARGGRAGSGAAGWGAAAALALRASSARAGATRLPGAPEAPQAGGDAAQPPQGAPGCACRPRPRPAALAPAPRHAAQRRAPRPARVLLPHLRPARARALARAARRAPRRRALGSEARGQRKDALLGVATVPVAALLAAPAFLRCPLTHRTFASAAQYRAHAEGLRAQVRARASDGGSALCL